MANSGKHAGGSEHWSQTDTVGAVGALHAHTHKDENKFAALWAFLPLDPTANTAETVALDLL